MARSTAQLRLPLDEAPRRVVPKNFDRARLLHRFETFDRNSAYLQWTLTSIRDARDQHIRGDFRQSAGMARAMLTDPAIYSALMNRLAPPRGLPVSFDASGTRLKGEAEGTFGADSSALASLNDLHRHMVMLGIGVGQLLWEPREDGSRLDVRLAPWPMHTVRWSEAYQRLEALTTEGYVEITHGDGKWIVFSLNEQRPWEWGAVKPLSMLWPDMQFGRRDRSQHSETQSMAKWVATMPEDLPMDHPDAIAITTAVQNLRKGRSGASVPFGTNIKMHESNNQAWQIWRELVGGDTKDVDRVLLGQDGALTKEGGNYIQAAELHNVRYDLVEGDLGAMQRALATGLFRVWSLVNIGREDAIKGMRWLLPDVDEDARQKSIAERTKAFYETIAAHKSNGFELDQDFVNALAADYGIRAPKLGPSDGA